eukprot:CAMPEP_0172608636 /NCGR_PEP_ID=MMETSP1068-20121228/28707_1 /TAXON_ID=35684 /ORGANISM="Pseudopedinella elastica, Strain CCMP716" /LENGTH=287 /DNA_ID=CAMNT_0013411949 /DNA_START=100 /DNA_END=959 /DNA_ORIENTATION=-
MAQLPAHPPAQLPALGFFLEEEAELELGAVAEAPPARAPEPLAPREGPWRLDDFEWDEALSEEMFDEAAVLGKGGIKLLRALGGKHKVVGELLRQAEKGETIMFRCLEAQFSSNTRDPSLDALTLDDLTDGLGRNFLHVASAKGQTLAVVRALRGGMDIDRRATTWFTPLMFACAWGRLPAARVLLDLGADPAPRDKDGRTALSLASEATRVALSSHPRLRDRGLEVLGSDLEADWAAVQVRSKFGEARTVGREYASLPSGLGASEAHACRLFSPATAAKAKAAAEA